MNILPPNRDGTPHAVNQLIRHEDARGAIGKAC